MANRVGSQMLSVGPGSLGPGTSVVQSRTNPSRSRGVITHMVRQANLTASGLAALANTVDTVFPGTSILLDYTSVRQISDDLALIVATYGTSSGSEGFRRVSSRQPNGYRDVITYDTSLAYTENEQNYNGEILLPVIRRAPLMVVRWSSLVYSDSRPNDNASLIGKFNNNTYTIDGYVHQPGTLRFEGTEVVHEKWGGIDRWRLFHAVTYDRLTKWENETLSVTETAKVKTKRTYALGDNAPVYRPEDRTTFPNLP